MSYYARNPYEEPEPPRCIECDGFMVEPDRGWVCNNPDCGNCASKFKEDKEDEVNIHPRAHKRLDTIKALGFKVTDEMIERENRISAKADARMFEQQQVESAEIIEWVGELPTESVRQIKVSPEYAERQREIEAMQIPNVLVPYKKLAQHKGGSWDNHESHAWQLEDE